MSTNDAPTGPSLFDALGLLAAVADDLVVATVRETHAAVADRIHGALAAGVGPAARPAELVHNAIAATTYGAIGLAFRGAGKGLDQLGQWDIGPRLDDDPRGRFVSSAVNGLIGEELLRERPHLAIPLAVRREGRDVDLTDAGLAAAFPTATGRLAIFLHGLCENESYWDFYRDRTGTTYGAALAERGWTPVFLRANTGLGIRENGAALASLMQRLLAAWPAPVERIALVGHSMGGLVMRAAAAVVGEAPEEPAWAERVSDVITLGTPHRGANLAKIAGWGSRVLGAAPESRTFAARILERRSEGIRDLTRGLSDDVPPLPHASYRLVAATVTRSARHPVAATVGDLLVTPRSAVGRDRRGRELFPGAETLHVARTDHFGLLNHPEVLAALERWLC